MMDEAKLLSMAAEEGFAAAALIETQAIPFAPGFLHCCEENLCGKYNANHACPPLCGTPAQMEAKVKAKTHALLLQTLWQIDDVMDNRQIKPAKQTHNRLQRQLRRKLAAICPDGFLIGASGCDFCQRCSCLDGQSCRFPEEMASCMSAYCIFVRELCEKTGLEYDPGNGLVAFFGMYVFSAPTENCKE